MYQNTCDVVIVLCSIFSRALVQLALNTMQSVSTYYVPIEAGLDPDSVCWGLVCVSFI